MCSVTSVVKEFINVIERDLMDTNDQPVNEGTCEMIEGETLKEASENLALRLRAEKIL